MSFYDIDKLHPQDLIVSYVLDCRKQGCFLPYSDYHIVSEWLGAAGDPDELLLVLSEVLPPYYSGDGSPSRRPRTLAGARKLVLSRLADRGMRRQKGSNG